MKVWMVQGFLKNYQCIREEERKRERDREAQAIVRRGNRAPGSFGILTPISLRFHVCFLCSRIIRGNSLVDGKINV